MKKLTLLILFFLYINFSFAEEEIKICDMKVDFQNWYNGPTTDKDLKQLEKNTLKFVKNIFIYKKLNCSDVNSTIKISQADTSKNKKNTVFGIKYLSKKTNNYENHYFINEKKVFSVDYKGFNSGMISRYGKHSLVFVEDIKAESPNPKDLYCQNNAGYYLDGKRVYCFEKINYFPNSFLKDRGLINFFSKNIYGQENYSNFELSDKIIQKIEQLSKTKNIQVQKQKVYKIIEKFNKNYESTKLTNIKKVDYINYEILNYLYGYLKLEDTKKEDL